MDRQTLKCVKISKDIEDNVLSSDTYVNIETFEAWLNLRNIKLHKDWMGEYCHFETEVAECAAQAILEKRRFKEDHPYSTEEMGNADTHKHYISSLEAELSDMKFAQENKVTEDISSLNPKEKESLLKIIIGMAVDGYAYNPKEARSPIAKEIETAILNMGLSITDDTIRKWLRESAELLPQKIEGYND